MNERRIWQLFDSYIEKFEVINTKHEEYYKWQIAKDFKPMMDAALEASSEEFASKLYDVKRLTANLIDSYTTPLNGLCVFAKSEPETVRAMFKELLHTDDGGDIEERRKRIVDFLNKSHALREKYSPDSYLYKDDFHSVTGYMFLYDPDNNYFFKASHALKFADCVEYYDDWGSGDNVKLDVYYRMCDQLVDYIKNNNALLKTNESRFAGGFDIDPETMHPDLEKHILAFDMIYCCSTYNLFDGISFVRPKTSERQLMQERKDRAKELYDKMVAARGEMQRLTEAKDYVNDAFAKGVHLHHKKYGEGIIIDQDGNNITVEFSEVGPKKLGTHQSVAIGVISVDTEEYKEKIKKYIDILKKENSVKAALSYSEKQFQPYADYLD